MENLLRQTCGRLHTGEKRISNDADVGATVRSKIENEIDQLESIVKTDSEELIQYFTITVGEYFTNLAGDISNDENRKKLNGAFAKFSSKYIELQNGACGHRYKDSTTFFDEKIKQVVNVVADAVREKMEAYILSMFTLANGTDLRAVDFKIYEIKSAGMREFRDVWLNLIRVLTSGRGSGRSINPERFINLQSEKFKKQIMLRERPTAHGSTDESISVPGEVRRNEGLESPEVIEMDESSDEIITRPNDLIQRPKYTKSSSESYFKTPKSTTLSKDTTTVDTPMRSISGSESLRGIRAVGNDSSNSRSRKDRTLSEEVAAKDKVSSYLESFQSRVEAAASARAANKISGPEGDRKASGSGASVPKSRSNSGASPNHKSLNLGFSTNRSRPAVHRGLNMGFNPTRLQPIVEKSSSSTSTGWMDPFEGLMDLPSEVNATDNKRADKRGSRSTSAHHERDPAAGKRTRSGSRPHNRTEQSRSGRKRSRSRSRVEEINRNAPASPKRRRIDHQSVNSPSKSRPVERDLWKKRDRSKRRGKRY